MSGGYSCQSKATHYHRWRVLDRNCNYSAFRGYRLTYSDYSALICLTCGSVWRSKANYIEYLYDISAKEKRAWLNGTLHSLPSTFLPA